jgi:hypothetical protein
MSGDPLIGACVRRNPGNLQNDREAKNTVYYGVSGVVNSTAGKPSDAALYVRNLLGLDR